jgi:diguanylate cyclase (GGDEF)-like protein
VNSAGSTRRFLQSTATKFAVVSLVPIVTLGWLLSSALRETVESRTEAVYAGTTTAMFNMASDVIARPEDFTSGDPLQPERAAMVDELIRRIGVDEEQVRVRMITPDRTVIYASRAADVGTTVANHAELQQALSGRPGSELIRGTASAPDGIRDDLIEIYIPVRFAGDATVHGAIIAAGIDHNMVRRIDSDVRGMRTSLAIGLAALWLALFPIASSLSRRLRKQSDENRYLALHDTLTGLPNRNLLADRLERAIAASARTGEAVGLLLIDLDRFKEVNDTLGHGKGDQLLAGVAHRLARTVRTGDTVARLGGDEFAVVVTQLSDPADLADVADRVMKELFVDVVIDGIDVAIQASIGAALYPVHAVDAEQLLQHADIAMYAAKAAGEDFVLYTPEIDSHSPSRLALAADLNRALVEHDQLVLHYQPVASPHTGQIQSMEALVRWHHPTRGLLQPLDFIPMAEQSGLIRGLTLKVLDLAVAQMREWMDAGADLTVAVNLSAGDLRSMNLLLEVEATLRRHDVPADRLELEVTETGVLAHPETAVELVTALRAMGVRIALDDFGTGYSSLTYLKRLNPDRLKIDRSFVDAMTHQSTDAEIVRSLIDLAHNLAIGVTAEGVETEEHWDLLRDLACDLVQGYYLARPMAASAATSWLAEWRSAGLTAPPR